MPSRPEWIYLLYACSLIGALLVPLNTRYKPREAAYILSETEPEVLVLVDRFLRIDFTEYLHTMLIDPGSAGGGRGAATWQRKLRKIVGLADMEFPDECFVSMAGLVAAGSDVDRERLLVGLSRDPREVVLIQYTSGTTAFPRGAMTSNEMLLKIAGANALALRIGPKDCVFSTQPFYHQGGSGGTVPLPAVSGCRVVIPEYYTPKGTLELIERERCTVRYGFASMYISEMELPEFARFDLSSLRAGWVVAPEEVMRRVAEAMGTTDLIQIYGSSEAGGAIGSLDDPPEVRFRSIGRPFPGTELSIREPGTTEEVIPEKVGEICCRGWYTMQGYYNRPDESKACVDAGGWIHTGDLGWIDGGGHLHFVGRLKDMIKPGGENVAAEEVEAVLLANPAVNQVAVIGIPDPRLGEVPMAFVECRRESSVTAEELIEYCKEALAGFKVPKEIVFVLASEWPMTSSGKIKKQELRERHAEAGKRPPAGPLDA
jgi:fatty-acyl-CoA synthase/long-chain acyl-CoA synthetase